MGAFNTDLYLLKEVVLIQVTRWKIIILVPKQLIIFLSY